MFDLEQQAYDLGYQLDSIQETELEAEIRSQRPIVQPGFQVPNLVWALMIACYVTFFAAMTALTWASGIALFGVVISMFYTIMFFATGSVLAKLPGIGDHSPLDRGQPLETWCGPMSRGSVFGQMLIVPFGIALFGLSIVVINALV